MDKNRLSRFISKYNLAGLVESVSWKAENKTLTTRFISDDKTVLGSVSVVDFDFEDSTVGVYNTNTLKSLLGVLGNDVNITLKKVDEKPISLSLTSDATTVQYQLADLAVIPNVPDLKNMRKVVRGGSWKDVAYFLQVSTRDFEYADTSRSYIGFRTVQDYMGTSVTGNAKK